MIRRRRVPDVILTSEILIFLDMFAHCKFLTVNVRGLSDDIFGYFKYRCHFDIILHLLTGGNLLKSIRMTSIFNGSTCALSFDVILTSDRVCTSSLLCTPVGNLFLLVPFSSLITRHS